MLVCAGVGLGQLIAFARQRRWRWAIVPAVAVIGLAAWGIAAGVDTPLWIALAVATPTMGLPIALQWRLQRAVQRGWPRRAARVAWLQRRLGLGRPGLPETLHALADLAEGRRDTAAALIDQLAATPPHQATGRQAEALRDWLLAACDRWPEASHSKAADIAIRAKCELGELDEAVEMMARPWARRRLSLRMIRHARSLALPALAFAGRPRWAVAMATLMRLPAPLVEIWRCTALAAEGHEADARAGLEIVAADARVAPAIRHMAWRRLEHLPPRARLSPEGQSHLDALAPEIRAGLALRSGSPLTSPFTLAALVTLIAMHLLPHASGWDDWEIEQHILGWAMVVDAEGTWIQSPWRLMTYGLLHQGPTHLLTNLAGLALLGPVVERLYGLLGGLLICVGSVIGGGLIIGAFGGYGVTLGASGGVMGLMGALVAAAWVRQGLVGTHTARAVATIGVALWVGQSIFDLLMPQISFAGHLGGGLTGALIGALLPTRVPLRFDEAQKTIRRPAAP